MLSQRPIGIQRNTLFLPQVSQIRFRTIELDLPPLTDGDHRPQLLARARGVLEYYQDDARAAGIALLRSLDLDGGALFRSELERRMQQPWSSKVTGPDAEIRLKLIPGVLLGVGLFSLGALIEPDRPPLDRADADALIHHLATLLAVCLDDPSDQPNDNKG